MNSIQIHRFHCNCSRNLKAWAKETQTFTEEAFVVSLLLRSTPSSTGLTSSGMCPGRQQGGREAPSRPGLAGDPAGGPAHPQLGTASSPALVAEGAEQGQSRPLCSIQHSPSSAPHPFHSQCHELGLQRPHTPHSTASTHRHHRGCKPTVGV